MQNERVFVLPYQRFHYDYIVYITSLVRKDSVRILQKTPFTHGVFVRCSVSGAN